MKKKIVLLFIPCLLLIACGKTNQTQVAAINSFLECQNASFEIINSYPKQCKTPDGQLFTQILTDLEEDKMKTQLVNPASVFCIEQGGVLEINTDENGEYGMCKFADGTQCEEWKFYRGECEEDKVNQRFSEEESMEVAKIWVLSKSPTYLFDGSDLLYEQAQGLECPDCYKFIFSFESKHAGFGNRKDLMLAQIITPHVVTVNVEKGRVVSVITDGKYNEIGGQLIQ